MARKIITNNDTAWELTGVAKRLSFAVANMNLPIANLFVNTPGGGSVSVFRHGDMEIWDLKSGGETYFEIMLLRDDGTYLGEDDIFTIEIHLSQRQQEWYAPILYVVNSRDSYYYMSNKQDYEDTFYNLDSGGNRAGKRYNPDTKTWTFSGHQRLVYFDSEGPNDKPTKPPYMSNGSKQYASKYDSVLEKYVTQKTDGYLIVVNPKNVDLNGGSIRAINTYYKKETKYNRGFKRFWEGSNNRYAEASILDVGKYILRVPYMWTKYIQDTTRLKDGYVYYNPLTSWPHIPYFGFSDDGYSLANADKINTFTYTVKSSIPYYRREYIYKSKISCHGVLDENFDHASYSFQTYVKFTGEILSGTYPTGYPLAMISSGAVNYPITFTPSLEPVVDPSGVVHSGSIEAVGGGFPWGAVENESHRISSGIDIMDHFYTEAQYLEQDE
jgi:hypothetical protein